MNCEYYKLGSTDRFPMGPLRIDIPSLYERIPIKKEEDAKVDYVPLFQDKFHLFIYAFSVLPLYLRSRLKFLLRKTSVDDIWLRHFQDYWVHLGGRPLWHTSDFFFLRNFFRLRQPPLDESTIEGLDVHLATWQNPEFIYSLFHAVLQETFSSELAILRLLRSMPPSFSSVLEFGCGSAIITSSILQHRCYKPKSTTFVIADLPTLTFHYATYKFRKCSNVIPITLLPKNNFQLITNKRFDVVFCCQVFEHLSDPMQTINTLYEVLNNDGLLYFDYIISEAKGLDTLQGLTYRNDVLDFITDKFVIEFGSIDKTKNIGLTVARKVS